MAYKSIHKTSTGKIFKCYDVSENPVNYEDYKHIFRSYLSLLEVGQRLKHDETGIVLERIK